MKEAIIQTTEGLAATATNGTTKSKIDGNSRRSLPKVHKAVIHILIEATLKTVSIQRIRVDTETPRQGSSHPNKLVMTDNQFKKKSASTKILIDDIFSYISSLKTRLKIYKVWVAPVLEFFMLKEAKRCRLFAGYVTLRNSFFCR